MVFFFTGAFVRTRIRWGNSGKGVWACIFWGLDAFRWAQQQQQTGEHNTNDLFCSSLYYYSYVSWVLFAEG